MATSRVKNDSQLAIACVRCGQPAAPHGEHHAIEKGGGRTSGKGMGGSSLDHEAERIPLCRKDHNATHAGTFTIERTGDGLIRCADRKGGVLSLRAMQELDAPDFPEIKSFADAMQVTVYFSDLALIHAWDNAEADVVRALVKRAAVAYTFWQRYNSYGDKWWERVADLIRQETGTPLARRTVYNARDVAVALMLVDGDPVPIAQQLGLYTLMAIGKANKPAKAFQYALERRDAGARMTLVANEVREKYVTRSNKVAGAKRCDDGEHMCRWCGDLFEVIG